MIGIIEGRVCHLSAPVVCIMTASGVGYEVELPLPAFCQLQLESTVSLWTHLHVREDAQLLYGFLSRNERDVFRLLIKINGVGAKMALAMMSSMSISDLKHCVDSGDEVVLTRVPGIGKKTAQRLLIELKGKFDDIVSDALPIEGGALAHDLAQSSVSEGIILAEVESALISLGYREKEAQAAIKLARDFGNNETVLDTQTLLKMTLQQLSSF